MIGDVAIACVDVGSEAGWALVAPHRDPIWGDRLSLCTGGIVDAFRRGERVALGFECPLYFPIRSSADAPMKGRQGEGSPPWCAGPGPQALVAGLRQVNAVLRALQSECPDLSGSTRWEEFAEGKVQLLIWEAYVTSKQGGPLELPLWGDNPPSQHEKDAVAGAVAFRDRMGNGVRSDLPHEASVSIAGFQLLATGLSSDISLLRDCCLVVRARKPS
jgi:hypothetical protein